MLALVIGGAGSGKSEYAEQLAVRLSEQAGTRLVYLATMVSGSGEADARIARHRKNRAGRGFQTIERYLDLAGIETGSGPETGMYESVEESAQESAQAITSQSTVLLEDLGNLMGNEMFMQDGGGPDAVLAGIRHVRDHSADLIIVANEVFSDGRTYDPETMAYLYNLALIHRTLAEQADMVVEVAGGLPNVLKNKHAALKG